MEELEKPISDDDNSVEATKSQTGPKHIYPRWECPVCGARIWAIMRNDILDILVDLYNATACFVPS